MGTCCGSTNAGNKSCLVSLAGVPPETEIRSLSTETTWRDTLGGWRVRWGIGRMRYLVEPGLCRVGQPDANSPVLVTANYKLTVDTVRRSLTGQNVWLLILDTKGVNVWCAAGKGTFGTAELIRRIQSTNLAGVVKHRNLVLPQLGATGVAAHEVKRASGFSVHYGPVRARDIPAYLTAGMKAAPAMRQVTFGWKERLVLAPMEIVGARKMALAILVGLAILNVIRYHRLTAHLATDFLPFVAAFVTGGLVVPLLLPWLPFRAFALKGAVLGALLSVFLLLWLPFSMTGAAGTVFLVTAITAYMAMMFTGSTTFTTLAGVRLEVRRALPLILIAAALGVILRAASVFV